MYFLGRSSKYTGASVGLYCKIRLVKVTTNPDMSRLVHRIWRQSPWGWETSFGLNIERWLLIFPFFHLHTCFAARIRQICETIKRKWSTDVWSVQWRQLSRTWSTEGLEEKILLKNTQMFAAASYIFTKSWIQWDPGWLSDLDYGVSNLKKYECRLPNVIITLKQCNYGLIRATRLCTPFRNLEFNEEGWIS
jgi:hypothetical protein